MIIAIARRLRARLGSNADAGLSIVEVVIALFVFAIIALGVLSTMGTTLGLNRDNRGREVAANLAAQTIDKARAIGDVFSILDSDTSLVVNNITYSVHRDVSWVTTTGLDADCGTGSGDLLYKRVNVTVTWSGMRAASSAVRADTVIAPNSKITSPDFSTILVSVQSITGSGGIAGMKVSIAPASPANGAVALTAQPPVTNAQGCSYALKVVPGNYTVTISAPSGEYRNEVQVENPSKVVSVGAGSSASAGFTYDPAVDFAMHYAGTYAPTYDAEVATNFDTTFLSTYGNYLQATPDADVYLSPIPAGYVPIAGPYSEATDGTGCLSPNPLQWPASTDGRVGKSATPRSGMPGESVDDFDVPAGVVIVKTPSGSGSLTATSSNLIRGTGDPGCAKGMTYTFPVKGGSTRKIALPYGTWSITFTKNGSSQAIPVSSLSGYWPNGGPVFPLLPITTIFTLDPRTAP